MRLRIQARTSQSHMERCAEPSGGRAAFGLAKNSLEWIFRDLSYLLFVRIDSFFHCCVAKEWMWFTCVINLLEGNLLASASWIQNVFVVNFFVGSFYCHLVKSCLQRTFELLSANRKEQSPDPKKEGRKQRAVRTKSASKGQLVGFFVMSAVTYGNSWQKQSRDEDRECGEADASKDGAALLLNHTTVTQQVARRGCPTLRDALIQPMEAALNQPMFLTQAQALLGKAIGERTTRQNAAWG